MGCLAGAVGNFLLEMLGGVGMDLTDGFKKLALAAVGAGAITYEKTSQIVDQLVKKGEITVDQGRAMNQELKHNVKEAAEKQKQEFRDAAARARESAAAKQASKEDESRTVDSTATEVIDDAAKAAKDIIDVMSKLSADQIAAVKKVIDSLDKTETGEKDSTAEKASAEKEDTPKEDGGN